MATAESFKAANAKEGSSDAADATVSDSILSLSVGAASCSGSGSSSLASSSTTLNVNIFLGTYI